MRVTELRSDCVSLILVDIITLTPELNFLEKGSMKTGEDLV